MFRAPRRSAARTAGLLTCGNAGEFSQQAERRMLTLASSLAGQAPVILGDAITGIDDRNVGLLVQAVLHASGQRQFPAC